LIHFYKRHISRLTIPTGGGDLTVKDDD